MTSRTEALPRAAVRSRPARALSGERRRVADFVALTKPRVVVMILVATGVGFYLGSVGAPDFVRLVHTLVGTALAAGGTLALNQFLERGVDARMERTRGRPLPDGRLRPPEALLFGMVAVVTGLVYLVLAVGLSSLVVTAATVVLYLFAYTPLKLVTPLCVMVGAVPGALPPVTGWVSARGELGVGAVALFAILFLWQLPHTSAIARLYQEDYARGGIRVLPVVDPAGASTERQILAGCLALCAVGPLPTLLGMAGPVYFVGAVTLSVLLLGCGLAQALARSGSTARRLLFASLLYLPALLALMTLDKTG